MNTTTWDRSSSQSDLAARFRRLCRLLVPFNTFHISTLPRTERRPPSVVLTHMVFDRAVDVVEECDSCRSPPAELLEAVHWWKVSPFATHTYEWESWNSRQIIEESLRFFGHGPENFVVDTFIETKDRDFSKPINEELFKIALREAINAHEGVLLLSIVNNLKQVD